MTRAETATLPQQDTLLRLPQVLSRYPVSKSGWLEGVRCGRFPKGVLLSPKVRAWRASDIDALINSLR